MKICGFSAATKFLLSMFICSFLVNILCCFVLVSSTCPDVTGSGYDVENQADKAPALLELPFW